MGLTRRQIATLIVMVFGTFVAVLNQTLVTPALPSIMTEMSVDATTAQWLTTGFTLVNAIMIPITAFLIDRFSVRNLFLSAMGTFALGTLMAGIAPNFAILLLGRLVQAAGEGVMMPLVSVVLLRTFPVEKRGSAMGLFGIVIAFAPAIGPTAAGFVIDQASWRDLFYIITGLAALMVVLAFFLLERGVGTNKDAKLDIPSVILSSVGFGALLYGLSIIGSEGVSIPAIVAAVIGVVTLVFFFHRQLHMDQPMLQVRVLANRKFLISTVIGMLIQAALMAASILVPIYLQSLRGFSATASGLAMLPGALVMGLMGIVAGRLFDKHGPRMLSIVGTGLLTLSSVAFVFFTDSTTIGFITLIYTVRMFSMSLVNMPINTWGMNALDDRLINHGTSVSNTFRQVAGSLGTAVIVSVSTAVTNSSLATMDQLHASIHGTNMAFLVSTIMCAVGLLLVVLLVRDKQGDTAKADPGNLRRGILESVMKTDVYTLPASASVLDAVRLFVDKHISAAPLVDEKTGEAIGFVSDGDVMRYLSKRSQTVTDPIVMINYTLNNNPAGESFAEKLDALMKAPAREIGSKGVIGVDVHADLSEVCRVLGENHLKKVAVLENGHVVGVINRSDITLYALQGYVEQREEAEEKTSTEVAAD